MKILLWITGLLFLVKTNVAQSDLIPDSIISFKWINSIVYLPDGNKEVEVYQYKHNRFKHKYSKTNMADIL